MGKSLFPMEVPFRVFVAITFAGTITFHILGLGIHTYIGQKKNTLVSRIETLSQVRSTLLGVESGLSILEERLQSVQREATFRKAMLFDAIRPQVRAMTLLLEGEKRSETEGRLLVRWKGAAHAILICDGLLGDRALACLVHSAGTLSQFDQSLTGERDSVSAQLVRVERFQSELEHWDSTLYWMTTILGLLFMALGWRNVLLQVGNPIENVTTYLETNQEKGMAPSSRFPAFLSIRELRVLKENMKKAHKDQLTGLLTRQSLMVVLHKEIEEASRHGALLTIAFIDIDHFNRLNERYGDAAGDEGLCYVATLIETVRQPKDSLGRFGDDRFLLLLPEIAPDKASGMLEALREKIAIPFKTSQGIVLSLTVRVGICGFRMGEGERKLVERGEQALVLAKSQGGNRVVMDSS